MREMVRKETLYAIFPFLAWLPELKQGSILRADLIAGFSVAMLLIPQSMAYAHLAGLPTYMGLYAAFIPPIVAALFGSSRCLSTGPVPVAALLTAVAMQPIVASGTPQYIQYVLLLTFLAGMIQFALGILRFGVIVNFISYPVILGFINAVALIIAGMQLGNLLGVYSATASHFYQMLWQVLYDASSHIHWPTVGIACLAFVIMLGGRRVWPHFPHTLFAVVITSVIAWWSGYEKSQTIYASQIINLSVQEMLENYTNYADTMNQLINEVKLSKQTVQQSMNASGAYSEKADEAINQLAQKKWELERLIARHNFEVAELNRLRFRRLITQDNREVFFVEEQMTPIGVLDKHNWRIASMPIHDKMTMQGGGRVIGSIPQGLPAFTPVTFTWDGVSALFMSALVIALVGFTEAITIAKRIAAENRQFLNVNQELIGQGLAKMAGSFFQSMPVSGGFSRSAVNCDAGAKTGFSSIIAGLIVMIVLLWFTHLFYYLPYATLAALIMVGVLGLLDLNGMWKIWQISRREGFVAISTFLLTLVLAPQVAYAVVLGMLLSLGFYLYETMRPRFTELTRNKQGELVELVDEQKLASCDFISVIRFHGALYFANAAYFEGKILKLISRKKKLKYIILDGYSINHLDATGLATLTSIYLKLEEVGIKLWFSRIRRPVLSVLMRSELYKKIGESHFYHTNEKALHAAIECLDAAHVKDCPFIMNNTR